MANPEHLRILKEGWKVWNAWRKENSEIKPDLSGADLIRVCLIHADLCDANLSGAALAGADLNHSNLNSADIRRADLSGAQLSAADLRGANLEDAGLSRANLFKANLQNSRLTRANLSAANLNGVDLSGAALYEAQMYLTNINDVDLRQSKGLDSVRHRGPSSIGIDTLAKSLGQISEAFLKGCGLLGWQIEYAKLFNLDLSNDEAGDITYRVHNLRTETPIQTNPLFISYSHANAAFVEKLEQQFDQRGIRYWRDVHDLKAGRTETQIDRAIRLNPTVLLVLSKNSVGSDWVEWEAAKARELEKELSRDVLCPVALDDTWKTCSWPGPLRRQIEGYHTLDFSGWRDEATFERQFAKLLDGLKLFYKS